MKFYYVILIIFFLTISFCCTNPYEDEGYYETKYSICTIKSDGTELIKLRDYGGIGEIFYVANDSLILVRRDQFYLMDNNGENEKQIKPPQNIAYAQISPDSYKVIFSGSDKNGGDLYILNILTEEIQKITDSPLIYEQFPEFSHDGNFIVYSTYIKSGTEKPSIKMINLDNLKQEVIIIQSDGNYSHIPFWHPCFGIDDNKIFYIKEYQNPENRKISYSLYSVNINGSNNTLVDSSGKALSPISTSGDGQKITYLGEGSPAHIFTINSDGTGKIDLGECTKYPSIFRVSKDGSKVVFGKTSFIDGYVYIVNIDGTNRKRLVRGSSPYFSSNGLSILFLGIE